MAIFKCDSCGYERDVPDKLLGKKAKCPDCGQGVTIVDQLPEEDDSFDSLFDDAVVEDESPVESVEPTDGESLDSIDLDRADAPMGFEEPEDIVCAECGHVVSGEHDGTCPQCGKKLHDVDELPEPTEADVDLSDLADDPAPQVWEAEFSGGGGEADAAIEDEPSEAGWRLFKGSFPLNFYAGIVSGVLAFFFAIAMTMLATAQSGVHDLFPHILGMALTGMAVGGVFFSLQSRIPFAIAGPETVLTAILFLLIGGLYRSMAGDFGPETILPTVLVAVALTAFIAGMGIWLLGKLKVGEYIRYIPIQIIGGVIGGVGVFVLLGALDWMGTFSLDWTNLYTAIRSFVLYTNLKVGLYTMGPSVGFGLLLFIALWRSKNSLFMLAMILVAAGAGYAAGLWGEPYNLSSLAVSIPMSDGNSGVAYLSEVFKTGLHANIQWALIKANSMYIGALGILASLTVMFRVTHLEMLRGNEADLNGEYRALGMTNMLSGLCGGMPVSLTYGRSAGNYATGARGPIAGIVAGLVCGVGLFFAPVILPMIPRFVPEGLLIYAGLDVLRGWLFKTRSSFTRRDDTRMLWMAFLVTVLLGIVEGVGFGLVLALMVAVSRYSRGGAIRNILSGANHRSNVDRAPAQQRTLKEFGDHIHIIRLQGFLFLGSMEHMLNNIRGRLDNRNMLPVEFLILDFKLVTGLASAAGIGFDKLRALVDDYGIQLIITSAPLELEEHLEQSGHVGEGEGLFKAFFNLDFALEWCENHVLEAENMLHMKQLSLPELLAPVFPEPKHIPALMKVLKRVAVDKGEAVFRQGDSSDSMYFVESGRLDVELELEGGKLLRLKKVGPGAVFGEMGIYTLAPRSATIRAAEKCVLYMMTTEKLDAIEKRAPVLVTSVNRFLINMLSERLVDANAKVRDLMD